MSTQSTLATLSSVLQIIGEVIRQDIASEVPRFLSVSRPSDHVRSDVFAQFLLTRGSGDNSDLRSIVILTLDVVLRLNVDRGRTQSAN